MQAMWKMRRLWLSREAPDCSPQTEPTWRGRALSPHGGGRHSAHMEGADTHAAFEYSLRTDSDLGSDATPVHIEGAATQFTLRTGQTACAASDPVSDLKLAEMYLKLPEIRVCPPELVMPKTCK